MSRVFRKRKLKSATYSANIALKLPEDNDLLTGKSIKKITNVGCSVQVTENAEGVVTLVISGTKNQTDNGLAIIRSMRENCIGKAIGRKFSSTFFCESPQNAQDENTRGSHQKQN